MSFNRVVQNTQTGIAWFFGNQQVKNLELHNSYANYVITYCIRYNLEKAGFWDVCIPQLYKINQYRYFGNGSISLYNSMLYKNLRSLIASRWIHPTQSHKASGFNCKKCLKTFSFVRSFRSLIRLLNLFI